MKDFFDFLNNSVTEFNASLNIAEILKKEGFIYLDPSQKWDLKNGGNYYTIKDQTSVIAFKIGQEFDSKGFNIVSSHIDSPNLKVKPNGVISSNNFTSLNTEVYGGPIFNTWFDRPLSIAGRIIISKDNKISSKVINIDKDLLVIPNVAIHLNKDPLTNPQRELPLASLTKYDSVQDLLKALNVIKDEELVSFDLSVYNRNKVQLVGVNDELFMSPRIDNLECAYTSLKAFINANNKDKVNVYCAFNNEEVGSQTKQGAASTILYDVLRRIVKDEELYQINIASSVMMSADNAHAVHPNHPEMADPTNKVFMNKGIVIKHNANQRYTTDAISDAIVQTICKNNDVPFQHYTNRSDQRGGGTLGSISTSQVSLITCDIGLAQLAMHSANETSGVEDYHSMVKFLTAFYNSNFKMKDNDIEL